MTIKTFTEVAESFKPTDARSPRAYRKSVAESPQLMAAIAATAKLFEAHRDGSLRATATLMEAISSDDLVRWATGQLIDREVEGNYSQTEAQWPKLFKRTQLRNFRPKAIGRRNGIENQYFYDIPELTEYPQISGGGSSEYFIQLGKTGVRYGWSFEAQINDDLDQLMEVVNDFPQMARNTEDRKSLGLLFNLTTGAPATTFFNSTNANLGQMTLSRTSLLRVAQYLATKRDPISNALIPSGRLMLVVGPALAPVAEAVLASNTTEVTRTETDGTTTKTSTSNPVAGKFELVVIDTLPGNSWFVIPKPGSTLRTPLWMGFLAGYETPDYRYLNNQGRALGGGDLGPSEGSFEKDAVYYRARHICGAATGDPTLTYASDNTGGATEPAGMPTAAAVQAMLS